MTVYPQGATGYGLMSLTWRPDPIEPQKFFDAINVALDEGVTFFNSGEFYGPNDDRLLNLELLRDYFKKYPSNRSKMTVSVKGCSNLKTLAPDNSKESIEESVNRISSYFPDGKIDLFEPARMDLVHSVEEVIEALKPFIESGKIGGISLSEVNGDTIRRAYKVYPKISYVEEEFSLMHRAIFQNGVNSVCKEYNIPIVAYSPLGRGYLTGTIKTLEDIPEGDIRRYLGRWSSDDILKANYGLVELVTKVAKRKGCTPGQVALGWIRKHNEFPDKYARIIPIPSAASEPRLRENLTVVGLTDEEFEEINKEVERIDVKGYRYSKEAERFLEA
ncbi:DEKNAAC105407 [Brettanomyces naardenensis]|uniref:DEKNAAC105407 n=1 Tax=Brettanomyces naardenensis TaxID=13370 RepID=A0A448YTB8_BRENA|nr:DEKNAAC105407 [Brettanomyces naardenensis]